MENGYQNRQSCLDSCQVLDKVSEKKGIVRLIAMFTDGHSSQLDLDVLRFNCKKEVTSHVTPPDTTSKTQAFDQINASLYSAHNEGCDRFSKDNCINREVFMEVLGTIWLKWTNQEAIV